MKKRLLANSRFDMTLPDERYRSLVATKYFLVQLCAPRLTPRIPQAVRKEALSLLKHFPSGYHLNLICEKIPYEFAKEMEPLYRMVKKHQQDIQDSNIQQNVNW